MAAKKAKTKTPTKAKAKAKKAPAKAKAPKKAKPTFEEIEKRLDEEMADLLDHGNMDDEAGEGSALEDTLENTVAEAHYDEMDEGEDSTPEPDADGL